MLFRIVRVGWDVDDADDDDDKSLDEQNEYRI